MTEKSVVSITKLVDTRVPLRSFLQEDGWTLWEGSAIAHVTPRIASGTPDVILTEDSVEDGTWMDLLLLAQSVSPRSQVVVVSRIADERFWAEVLSMGGFDLLELPADRDEVIRVANAAWRTANTHVHRLGA